MMVVTYVMVQLSGRGVGRIGKKLKARSDPNKTDAIEMASVKVVFPTPSMN